MEDRNIIKEYSFGDGNLGVQAGYIEYTNGHLHTFIDLGELTQSYDIGSEPEEEPLEFTRLLIKNINALEVLQKAVDQCRNNLTNEK